MITIKLHITQNEKGIAVELSHDQDKPTAGETLFATQMAKTIAKFLNDAPKVAPKKT